MQAGWEVDATISIRSPGGDKLIEWSFLYISVAGPVSDGMILRFEISIKRSNKPAQVAQTMALPQLLRTSVTPPELELIASEQLIDIVPLVTMEKTAFISVSIPRPDSPLLSEMVRRDNLPTGAFRADTERALMVRYVLQRKLVFHCG